MSDTRDPGTVMGEAVKSMASRALYAEDPLVRKHAVYLLGTSRNPDCVELFIKALRDPEKAVRAQATRALTDMGEPASDPLISLLHNSDWKVRYRAAEALGLMKEKKAMQPLIRLLSDEKDHVRYMAVKSLGEILPLGGVENLNPLLHDENPYVRRMAESVEIKLKSSAR